jgi:putative ABC transport system permease protein
LILETFAFNIRYALRQFANNRGFAVAVVLTISLGTGLNTAMFSVIRAVLLQPLGYHDPDRLVLATGGASLIRFDEMTSSNRSYAGLGAYADGREDVVLSGDSQPEVLKGARVSGNFLNILGVTPLVGRSFLPAEDKPGAPAVAMISAKLWQRRFGARASMIGKTVTLMGMSYTIIGVLPVKFHFPFADTDVWLTRPSEWSILSPQSQRISPILAVFGRLKPNVDILQANAELAVMNQRYAAAHPDMLDANLRSPGHVRLLKDELVSDIRSKLWLLFGAVGLVLLTACANLASLLLARATARSREFAVRAAIGAGSWRIIGQLLTESTLLSLIGGIFGLALAELSVRVIRGMTALDLPRSGEIRIDGAVLVFAVILSLLTGLLFGLAPSLSASRTDLAGVLRGSGESATSVVSKPMFLRFDPRSLLVIGQVALSTILLIGATLLIESLARVYRVDPGFQVSNLLTMSIAPSPTRYDTDEKRAAFYDAIVQHVEVLPGVRSAAITRTLPMSGFAGAPVQVTGRPEMRLNKRPIAIIQDITPRYFQTMKIALKRGREFTAHDDAESEPVAIIDESMARLFWPQYPNDPSPIGEHILVGGLSTQPAEIVGIVADIRQRGLDLEPRPGVYLSSTQHPPESAMLAVRTESDPLSLTNAVRNQILALDRDQPVSEVTSMSGVVDASEGPLRVMMTLLGIFAGVATIIAVVGLYGVVAYSVAQRTKEIGIRLALGAQRGNILSLVGGQGLRLALGGVLLGVCGAYALTRVLQGLLFQISTTDPSTYIGIAVLFVFVALAASYFPARRAAGIDPLATLRL